MFCKSWQVVLICVACFLVGVGAAYAIGTHSTRRLANGILIDAYAMQDGGSVAIVDVGADHHFDVILTDSDGAQATREISFSHQDTMPDIVISEVCGDKLQIFWSWSDGLGAVYHTAIELPGIQSAYLPQVCRGK